MTSTGEKLEHLYRILEVAAEPAGESGIAKRASKGIPGARDRVRALLDPGTFAEIGALVRQPGKADAMAGRWWWSRTTRPSSAARSARCSDARSRPR